MQRLDPLFRPRSIAVVGASSDPRQIGGVTGAAHGIGRATDQSRYITGQTLIVNGGRWFN